MATPAQVAHYQGFAAQAEALKAEPIKVWGVPALLPSQKAAFKAHCTGDCGKISMAGVIADEYLGGFFVCSETVCPHMEKESTGPYGTTMSFGKPHEVWLRILKTEQAQS